MKSGASIVISLSVFGWDQMAEDGNLVEPSGYFQLMGHNQPFLQVVAVTAVVVAVATVYVNVAVAVES